MKIKDFALIAEIISAVAVVIVMKLSIRGLIS